MLDSRTISLSGVNGTNMSSSHQLAYVTKCRMALSRCICIILSCIALSRVFILTILVIHCC